MILLHQITSAVLQLLIFSGVPFVWYILTQKRVKGFFKWLGISTAPAPPLNAMFCILAGFLAALFLPYMWLYRSGNLNYQGFTVDAFRQTGWSIETSAVILIWAIVQTSLSEEILFRGFFVNACAINLERKQGMPFRHSFLVWYTLLRCQTRISLRCVS